MPFWNDVQYFTSATFVFSKIKWNLCKNDIFYGGDSLKTLVAELLCNIIYVRDFFPLCNIIYVCYFFNVHRSSTSQTVHQHKLFPSPTSISLINDLNGGASLRWSFGPNSAWWSTYIVNDPSLPCTPVYRNTFDGKSLSTTSEFGYFYVLISDFEK